MIAALLPTLGPLELGLLVLIIFSQVFHLIHGDTLVGRSRAVQIGSGMGELEMVGDQNIPEVGIAESDKNVAVMTNDRAVFLDPLTSARSLLYSFGFGGLFVIALQVAAILGIMFYGGFGYFSFMGSLDRNIDDK